MPDELMLAHIENLLDRVAALETFVAKTATKEDIESLVTVLEAGASIYKVIIWLGALAASVTAMFVFIKVALGDKP
jgi:hypothetical protein